MIASFNSRKYVGNFAKRITVTTNDPNHRKETLIARGRVLVPFKVKPRNVNFREIEDDTSPMPQIVTIERGDGGPLKLKVVPTKRGVEGQLREIKPGELYELTVSVSPPQKPGRLRSWIKLKTGVAEVPETTVPVFANIPSTWAGVSNHWLEARK